jgi:hypothetical protein
MRSALRRVPYDPIDRIMLRGDSDRIGLRGHALNFLPTGSPEGWVDGGRAVTGRARAAAPLPGYRHDGRGS